MTSNPEIKLHLYVIFVTTITIVFAIGGCKAKIREQQTCTDSTQTSQAGQQVVLDSQTLDLLGKKGIVPKYIQTQESSPDSKYITLVIDSTVRFGPGDPMWSEELPSNWYGVRNRTILYLFDPSADSLHQIAQCEEVVNLYDAGTSQPVQPERKEDFKQTLWSADSKRILLLKDRESDGVADQDVLIYTLGEDEPTFLDLFGVWRQLMKAYPGAKGTQVESITWTSDTTVKIIFSIRGMTGSPHHEFIFNTQTGKPVSSKEISAT